MSGFLSQALGSLLGNSGQATGALPAVLAQMLGGKEGTSGGGLAELMQQLEAGGLGEQIKSWIGTGPNQPVTGQQIAAAMPADRMQSLAQQLGLPPEAASGLLAQVLPHAVDHATPNGTLPDAGSPMPNFASLVGKLLG